MRPRFLACIARIAIAGIRVKQDRIISLFEAVGEATIRVGIEHIEYLRRVSDGLIPDDIAATNPNVVVD